MNETSKKSAAIKGGGTSLASEGVASESQALDRRLDEDIRIVENPARRGVGAKTNISAAKPRPKAKDSGTQINNA